MGQTITEKILAAHCGKKEVKAGEFIEPKVDIALGNDITAPLAIKAFRDIGVKHVFDPKKVALVLDHFTPNKDIASAEQCKYVRAFAKEQKLLHFYDGGKVGVEHALLPEQGIVVPGDLVIGADSHTCTYGGIGAFSTGVGSTDLAAVMATGKIWLKVPESIKFIYTGKLLPWVTGKDLILYTIGQIGVDGANYQSMEFTGEVISDLPVSDRLTICNMAIEAGAKNGIIAPDQTVLQFMRNRAQRKVSVFFSDYDARYSKIINIDCKKIQPQVACPPLPSNAKAVNSLSGITIDQAVIGSCTNGRIEDLRIAAKILKGKKVNKNVRLIILPATPEVYAQSLKEGLLKIFIDCGAIISPPTCGPCLGGHMGVLAKGERCIATTNRNFIGRMGHLESEVYLANPAVTAASALCGRITHPAKIGKK